MSPKQNPAVVNAIVGNIFEDRSLLIKLQRMKRLRRHEALRLTREEMQKLRLRRRTARGTEILIDLLSRLPLRNGDVLEESRNRLISIEQKPELVVGVMLKRAVSMPETLIRISGLVGHAVGNRHRSIAIRHRTIYFPVMNEADATAFRKVLAPFKKQTRVRITRVVLTAEDLGGGNHSHT